MNYKVNGLCALVIFVLGILFFCYDNALVQRAETDTPHQR